MDKLIASEKGYNLVEQKFNVYIFTHKFEPPLYVIDNPVFNGEIRINPNEYNDLITRRRVETRGKRFHFSDLEENRQKINTRISKLYPHYSENERKGIVDYIIAHIFGYGKIDLFLHDNEIEDIMCPAPGKPIFISHYKYGVCTTNIILDSEEASSIIERVSRETGKEINYKKPSLEAILYEGSRFTATIPPISDEIQFTIRKYPMEIYSFIDMIRLGTVDLKLGAFIWFVSQLGANLLFTGGPGTAKTSFMRVLCNMIPKRERIITIEDTPELEIFGDNWVALYTKPPNVEGVGGVDAFELFNKSLRMRPDRLIMGELRSHESQAFFAALNAGFAKGTMATMHALSVNDVFPRLVNSPMNVEKTFLRNIDLIVNLVKRYNKETNKYNKRIRKIAEVYFDEQNEPQTRSIFHYDFENKKFVQDFDDIRDIRIIQRVCEETGYSFESIQKDLDKREKLLSDLLENNVTGFKETINIIQKYYGEDFALL